jgi:NAD(P)-dependent dehydrogenase (short-subunit alcohol dehydrogenase family)
MALGRDVDRWSSGSLCCKPACCPVDGPGTPWSHRKHLFLGGTEIFRHTVYGISKAATDKMTSDMAHELQSHGVTVI